MDQSSFSIKKQIGISLLEVLLSLSIIAIIFVMATRYFFVATNNNKVNTSISQVGGLVAALHNWKGIKPAFTGASIQALYDAGQLENFPGLNDSSTANVSVNDLWGDSFSITSAVENKVTISVTLPNKGNCQALANAYISAICNGATFNYTFS